MQINKDKIKGIAGTIVFHALLFVGLILLALHTPLPLPEESGVEVNLGYSDEGMGDIQPRELATGEMASPPPTPTEATEDLITDDSEETPAIQPVQQKKTRPVSKPEPKPVAKPEPKPDPQPVVNPNAMYKGKSGTASQGGNEGITGKPGDQGKPNGNPDATDYDGTGGTGGGVSYSLSGRGIKNLPQPTRNFSERGTVVVTIYVNRAGLVTRVISGVKGTTTSNTQLLHLAEKAALQARFSPKEDAPEEQKGSITYIFELN